MPLEFYHRPYMGRDDFMPSMCNFEAYRLIDSWPMWNYFAACIYGPEGCGKTHLANIFSDNVSVIEHYPYKIPCIKAKDLTLDRPRQLLNKFYCLIVEDLSADINQEAMFNLYNMYRDEGGSILFTSREAPARINFTLADLRSRMNIVPSIEIKEPDDNLLSVLMVKLFILMRISQAILSMVDLMGLPGSYGTPSIMRRKKENSFALPCGLQTETKDSLETLKLLLLMD